MNAAKEISDQPNRRSRLLLRLFVAIATVAIIWLLILPQISKFPSIADHVEEMREKNINPSAMFYTELEDHP